MTDGALAAHDRGIVTACSVVAGGPDLERAARLLRERPGLEVGLHLVLAGAPLVSRREEVPSLLSGARPIAGYRAFFARWAMGGVRAEHVEHELRAQIARLREIGLRPTHLNGHQHLHVLPRVVDIVARVAREEGIGYARVPDERVLPTSPRSMQIWVLGRFARGARRILRAAGIATNDRAIGIVDAGHLSPATLLSRLRGARAVTEVVSHPGTDGRAIARAHAWGYDWDGEREALMDASVRDELARTGIALTRPSEVAGV